MPAELFDDINNSDTLIIIEDHVITGGLSEQFAGIILEAGIAPKYFVRFYARGYANKLYGSQDFYRKNNGLSFDEINYKLEELTT